MKYLYVAFYLVFCNYTAVFAQWAAVSDLHMDPCFVMSACSSNSALLSSGLAAANEKGQKMLEALAKEAKNNGQSNFTLIINGDLFERHAKTAWGKATFNDNFSPDNYAAMAQPFEDGFNWISKMFKDQGVSVTIAYNFGDHDMPKSPVPLASNGDAGYDTQFADYLKDRIDNIKSANVSVIGDAPEKIFDYVLPDGTRIGIAHKSYNIPDGGEFLKSVYETADSLQVKHEYLPTFGYTYPGIESIEDLKKYALLLTADSHLPSDITVEGVRIMNIGTSSASAKGPNVLHSVVSKFKSTDHIAHKVLEADGGFKVWDDLMKFSGVSKMLKYLQNALCQ